MFQSGGSNVLIIIAYSPWNSPGQNTGVGSLFLLQGIFPTQGTNPGLPHCRWIFTSWATRDNTRYISFTYYVQGTVCSTLYVFTFFFFNLFLFFYFIILYWFCHTLTWIRHRCTCVPHPEPPSLLPPHTIPGSSQCTSPEHPVSRIEPGLVIHFTC